MLSSWFQRPVEVEPYSKLAAVYDYVMRHVNYTRWAHYLRDWFNTAEGSVTRVLDIACGTGSLLAHLQEMGYQAAGFDNSRAMVAVANEKFRKQQTSLPVWQGLMWDFAVKQRFDVCVCTYDSLNYCLELEQCRAVLECGAESLRPGGLLIFDVCTERNSRKNFRHYFERDGVGEIEYSRDSRFLARERLQINEFLIQAGGRRGPTYREVHKQRIYRLSDLKGIIDRELFELVGLFDGFSRRPGGEGSSRVHFVLKRRRRRQ